jgi:hemerythrin-like domain-containing protein
MKFTHECFRYAIPKLTKQLKSLQTAKSNAYAVQVFIQEFQSLMTVYEEHAAHEDKIVFPAIRRFLPGLNPSMDEEVSGIIFATNFYLNIIVMSWMYSIVACGQ